MSLGLSRRTNGSKTREKALGALRLIRWFLLVLTGAFGVICVGGGLSSLFSVVADEIRINRLLIAAASLPVALLLLLLCHMLPVRLARKYTHGLERIFLPTGRILSVLLTPLTSPMNGLAGFLSKLFRADTQAFADNVTEEDIRLMVKAGGEKGSIEEAEKEMINNVFDFNNTSVGEICAHRKDIFALPVSAGIDEIIRAAAMERYTRIPVYSENIDNIVGILHIKDLFRVMMNETPDKNAFDLGKIIHKPYFVPLSKTSSRLFSEMQKNKVHIAIVVDEYGGTVGLVTLEDLVEEIMGSIQDEYDDEERPQISLIAHNTYEVDGAAELDNVAEFFKCPLPVDDYDTLAGFLIGQLGRVPADGEQPELEYEGLLFKIFKIEDRRISAVIVCKL